MYLWTVDPTANDAFCQFLEQRRFFHLLKSGDKDSNYYLCASRAHSPRVYIYA